MVYFRVIFTFGKKATHFLEGEALNDDSYYYPNVPAMMSTKTIVGMIGL